MKIGIASRFLRDLHGLSPTLRKKTLELIHELQGVGQTELRQKALPGWRLHSLRESSMVSLSVDMNFRILAQFTQGALILHRVVRHDVADRATVNRNDQAEAIVQMSPEEIRPADVYDALLSFGVPRHEAEFFRECSTEDDLLNVAVKVSEETASLALTLYETSGLPIPQARFRILQRDEDLMRLLEAGGTEWNLYLHPSQAYIVELEPSFRAAIVGSAGTGKTVCAWHRSKHLIDLGVSVGFVCPHESVLDISKQNLIDMIGPEDERSYFFVPKQPDELLQLADAVDHLIIDEAQEIPPTWFSNLAARMRDTVGLTVLYDLNQLGGNIRDGDTARYRDRIAGWKSMLSGFPRMRKFNLTINYRNAREIAECYLELLSEALPAKPFADVPVFESGEVLRHRVKSGYLEDELASILRRMLVDYSSHEIGVVVLNRGPSSLLCHLSRRKLPVVRDAKQDGIVITTAAKVRGHEREVMIVIAKSTQALCRSFGAAIDAYIAMSRAIKQLIVVEEEGR